MLSEYYQKRFEQRKRGQGHIFEGMLNNDPFIIPIKARLEELHFGTPPTKKQRQSLDSTHQHNISPKNPVYSSPSGSSSEKGHPHYAKSFHEAGAIHTPPPTFSITHSPLPQQEQSPRSVSPPTDHQQKSPSPHPKDPTIPELSKSDDGQHTTPSQSVPDSGSVSPPLDQQRHTPSTPTVLDRDNHQHIFASHSVSELPSSPLATTELDNNDITMEEAQDLPPPTEEQVYRDSASANDQLDNDDTKDINSLSPSADYPLDNDITIDQERTPSPTAADYQPDTDFAPSPTAAGDHHDTDLAPIDDQPHEASSPSPTAAGDHHDTDLAPIDDDQPHEASSPSPTAADDQHDTDLAPVDDDQPHEASSPSPTAADDQHDTNLAPVDSQPHKAFSPPPTTADDQPHEDSSPPPTAADDQHDTDLAPSPTPAGDQGGDHFFPQDQDDGFEMDYDQGGSPNADDTTIPQHSIEPMQQDPTPLFEDNDPLPNNDAQQIESGGKVPDSINFDEVFKESYGDHFSTAGMNNNNNNHDNDDTDFDMESELASYQVSAERRKQLENEIDLGVRHYLDGRDVPDTMDQLDLDRIVEYCYRDLLNRSSDGGEKWVAEFTPVTFAIKKATEEFIQQHHSSASQHIANKIYVKVMKLLDEAKTSYKEVHKLKAALHKASYAQRLAATDAFDSKIENDKAREVLSTNWMLYKKKKRIEKKRLDHETFFKDLADGLWWES
ncbi:hypothetical protein BC941DRAFT_510620 [Chlamydoabsidia padenii]|nr:hypothetical protein BC941DRAFT_510620 [Chlamydoabsidia padenii]